MIYCESISLEFPPKPVYDLKKNCQHIGKGVKYADKQKTITALNSPGRLA